MATAEEAVAAARSYLGEGPDRFCAWYPAPIGTAWCAIFQSYVLTQVGIPTHFAWVSGGFDRYRSEGRTFAPHEAQAGDLVAFDYDNGGPRAYDHVAIVESVNADGIIAINGNWQNRVQRVLHRWDRSGFAGGIAEIARPDYTTPAPPPPPALKGSHDMISLLTMPDGRGVEFRAFWGTVFHRWQKTVGGSWTEWALVNAAKPPSIVDSVSARVAAAGALELLAWNSADGTTFRSWQPTKGSTWSGWSGA
jgi:hypothetical protein